MNFSKINYIFIFVYFILPILVLCFGPLDSIGQIELTPKLKFGILTCLSVTAFIYLLTILYLQKSFVPKIEYALLRIRELDSASLKFFNVILILFFTFYGIWLFNKIDFSMSRDERFELIDNHPIGPLFMLMIKLGVLTSIISILKGKKLYPIIFISIIASITFLTLSRSLLVLVILPIIPFTNFSTTKTLTVMVVIFFSRYLLTDNLDLSWDWWVVFGFGEMLGVLFGPLAIMKVNPSVSIIESVNFILNAIPGVSFFTLFTTSGTRVPELAIYVNNLTKKNFDIYGVASTPYTDILLSPSTFLVSFFMLIVSFFYISYPKKFNQFWIYLIVSFYIAFGFSITSFYRWSFSGAVYTLLRDTILFLIFILSIKQTSNYFRKYLFKNNA